MQIGKHTVGMCSWSLASRDMADLAAQMRHLGLEHLHLNLGPLLCLDDARKHEELAPLHTAGIKFTAGMIGFAGEDYSSIAMIRKTGGVLPDAHWANNKAMATAAARLAGQLHLPMVSAHAGFIPPTADAVYRTVVDRVRSLADLFAAQHVTMLLETGQERATTLVEFLSAVDRPNLAVNFDPANMILYGAGDPIEAIGILGSHIRHVHIKDAVASDQPGVTWGSEMPFGKGQVNPKAFMNALHAIGYAGPLAIEREGGPERYTDILGAIDALRQATE